MLRAIAFVHRVYSGSALPAGSDSGRWSQTRLGGLLSHHARAAWLSWPYANGCDFTRMPFHLSEFKSVLVSVWLFTSAPEW